MLTFKKNSDEVKISSHHIAKEFLESDMFKNFQPGQDEWEKLSHSRRLLSCFITREYGIPLNGSDAMSEICEEVENEVYRMKDTSSGGFEKKVLSKTENIVNLTGHPVHLYKDPEGKELIKTISSNGSAHVDVKTVKIGEVNGIPLTKRITGQVRGLPDPEKGYAYIVSMVVCMACKGRKDLLVPNGYIRSSSGAVKGCRSFSFNPFYEG